MSGTYTRRRAMLQEILHEPLVHFLLLGALLFGCYALVSDEEKQGAAAKIIITRSQIEQLETGFGRVRRRPPTSEEMRDLIEDYVREEVMYREAIAMGLDRDDTVVRRRLRQKLEFLIPDSTAQLAPPTDSELQEYLKQHADKYRQKPKITFKQVFFSRERHGDATEAEATAELSRLNASKEHVDEGGDPSLLPASMRRVSEQDISKLFGAAFGERIHEVPVGRWAGPLNSSYGVHLVFVQEWMPGRSVALADIRDELRHDLLAERREQALDAAYAKLQQKYSIVIESTSSSSGGNRSTNTPKLSKR